MSSQRPSRPPAKQIGPGYTLRARPAARGQGLVSAVSIARASVPVPQKPAVKAKPGKQTPTAEERRWLDWVAQQPCVTVSGECSGGMEIHHMLRAGRRVGHLHTLPLCHLHHQGGACARHPWKARFEAAYGTEAELLAKLQARYRREVACA